jgi:stage II sporulation protein D
MKRYLFLLIFIGSFKLSFSQKISVSLFNELNLQTILVTPVSGSYSIVSESGSFIINPNQIIYISRTADSIKVRDMSSHLGTWKRVSIVGQTNEDVIRVNAIVPSMPARIYDDNLGFYVDFDRMMAINIVDVDKYIAGVVEAESGPTAHIDFYKAQALLARTYALGHMERHVGEGFNLCDEVHCQVYKGKSTKNPSILKATKETKGQVIIDMEGNLIVGAFHANCGGQTANSGDVWLTHHDYLTSIIDPYCKGQPSSQWEVKVSIDSWREFLISKGVDAENLPESKFVYNPKGREYIYPIEGKQIPLIDIRNHFKLRSAFFSIDIHSNSIRIKGHGYGHGVGMCQDGAMQMAKKGKSYREIIQHYFFGVSIVNHAEVNGINDDYSTWEK